MDEELFKLKRRKSWKDISTGKGNTDSIIKSRQQRVRSRYALRILGSTQSGPFYISEEEREDHLHILGTTGEGKSRLIEHLIREDINRGNGLCFLDPTDRAETAYNVLRYCAKIGFEKVCLIDPHTIHTHQRVSSIQPFHRQKSYRSASVANMMDTVRVLFQTRDAAETPRIQRYMSALLQCLWESGMTLHEALYFTDYGNLLYRNHREQILEKIHPLDRGRVTIEDVFKNYTRWQQYFSSTINRLEPFFDSTLDSMFGADKGIDFAKMITEGWVILVNLYSGLGFEPIHTRLLGTSVINEIIFALDRLRGRGWRGVYYLYIDEAGRYANRNLADLLAYKRKSGLRVTVAHQYFRQFEDPQVLEAVKQLTKIKVMFNTPNPADRLEMVKALGYGGEITPLMAQYTNSDLPKQTAIIKKGKEAPVRIKIHDVPEIKISKDVENEFITRCLSNEWNFSPKEVREQFASRFEEARPNPKVARGRTPPDKPADSGTVERRKSIFAKP